MMRDTIEFFLWALSYLPTTFKVASRSMVDIPEPTAASVNATSTASRFMNREAVRRLYMPNNIAIIKRSLILKADIAIINNKKRKIIFIKISMIFPSSFYYL